MLLVHLFGLDINETLTFFNVSGSVKLETVLKLLSVKIIYSKPVNPHHHH